MRLTPFVNDTLWRCLCPQGPRRALARFNGHVSPRESHTLVASANPSHSSGSSRLLSARRRESHHAGSSLREEISSPEANATSGKSSENVAVKVDRLLRRLEPSKYQDVQRTVEHIVKVLGHKPDRWIYEALILANTNSKLGSAQEVAKLLEECAEVGITPDSRIYHAALRALAVHPDHLLRVEVLENLRGHWLNLSDAGHHDVAIGLIRERQMELALYWVEQMELHKHDVQPWLYDMLIFCLCDIEELDEALRLLKKRFSQASKDGTDNPSPSANAWYYFLDAASRAMHYGGVSYAFDARVTTGYLNPPDGMCTNILTCASRNGDTQLATAVFNLLSKRAGHAIKLHHYETLTEAYLNRHDPYTALSLLTVTQSSGHLLTSASTRPFFMYLKSSLESTFDATDALESLRKENRPIPLAAINVVIEAFIHHAHFAGAIHLYDTMSLYSAVTPLSPKPKRLLPDVETYTLLLQGCLTLRDKPKAMFLAREMVALKIAPTASVYDRLVAICMHSDEDLEDAWRYVAEMGQVGIKLTEGTRNELKRKADSLRDFRVELLASVTDVAPTVGDSGLPGQATEGGALSGGEAAFSQEHHEWQNDEEGEESFSDLRRE